MMQSLPGSQRSTQRRSPIAEPNPQSVPMSGPSMSISGSQIATNQRGTEIGARSSSGSGKASSGKKKDQLSQIEKSVTHLLIATKQLLETLTRWSRHNASEGEVSDVYVRLGYEFNIACRAFQGIGVDVNDLGPVPDMLRAILEETLSQEASQASLDKYLPKIRDIIINLLHGLKKKQQKLRAKQNKDAATMLGSRQLSTASTSTTSTQDSTLTDMLEGVPSRFGSSSSVRTLERRTGSGGNVIEEPPVPNRTSSSQHAHSLSREDAVARMDGSPRGSMRERKPPPPSLSDSSMSSNTMQNIPVMTPEEYKLPIQRMSIQEELPPPPPPPKQSDALLALQRGGELERRASRRYSAYQISKHLGASPGGVPMLPTQNSPIPNRGRDVRDSLNAVRTRSSLVPSRSRSNRVRESPSRAANISNRISEERDDFEQPKVDTRAPPAAPQDDSPLIKTPEDKLGASYVDTSGAERPALGATLRGPPADEFAPRYPEQPPEKPAPDAEVDVEPEKSGVIHVTRDSGEAEEFIPEQSPQPGKELTLFLQYKSKIKKFVLPEGSNELSIARLQLAFIEKFAWNTHNNGVDLPEIYIQDPVSGVRHELEDLTDIKDRSVLVLNVEPLDEVKRHFDEGIGGLKKVVEGIRTAMDGQKMTIAQVSDRQDAAAKEMARLATLPPPAAGVSEPVQVNGIRPIIASDASKAEVQSLRQDLAVIRQTWTAFSTDINSSMAAIKAKADTVKAKAIDVTIPILEGDTGRSYVVAGKKTLGDDSETIVSRVDDLQDLVEDLRKDVVNRGVRPLPRQLDQVNKDISLASKDLKKMQDYVKREKPIWTKIWEKELEAVCTEREFLTLQEDLIMDLEDDMEKLIQTVALVEQATKQQNAQPNNNTGHGVTLRSASRGLNIDADVDPIKAKDGVLGEVRALRPNHENRLEAIERAEKARRRELENRREHVAFKRELGKFVEEGKLKSVGVEEIDKNRQLKDEENMKGEWQAQAARKAARAKARAEERARQEKAQAAAIEEGATEDGDEGEGLDGAVDDADAEGQINGVEDSDTPPPVPEKDEVEDAVPELPKVEGEPGSPSKRTSWLPSIFSSS